MFSKVFKSLSIYSSHHRCNSSILLKNKLLSLPSPIARLPFVATKTFSAGLEWNVRSIKIQSFATAAVGKGKGTAEDSSKASGSDINVIRNEDIKFPSLRVVYKDPSTNKSTWEILSRSQALKTAKTQGLDLILVNGEADPPVCKLEKFGNILSEMRRKEKLLRQSKKAATMKEMMIVVGIDPHDFKTKMNKIKSFLFDGHPVKITVFLNKKSFSKTQLHVKKNLTKQNVVLPLIDIDEITLHVLSGLEDIPVVLQQKDHFKEILPLDPSAASAKNKSSISVIPSVDRDGNVLHGQPAMIKIHVRREFTVIPKVKAMSTKKSDKD